jgi:GAF domain
VALIVGLYCAFRVLVLIHNGDSEIAEWWHFGVILTAVVEFVLADVLADRSFPFDTERKLALMEKRIGAKVIEEISDLLSKTIGEFRGCNNSMVSATVHIVAELTSTADQRIRKGLLQLTDYVGPDGGQKGRVTLITQGVIGRCARSGQIETVGFADEKEYLDEMVRYFGFSTEEAERHTKTGRSYLAVPLLRNREIVGVLYFFTSEPQVFPRAADLDRLNRVAGTVIGLIKVTGLA